MGIILIVFILLMFYFYGQIQYHRGAAFAYRDAREALEDAAEIRRGIGRRETEKAIARHMRNGL